MTIYQPRRQNISTYEVTTLHNNPIKQAEYLYSLIEGEVNNGKSNVDSCKTTS